MKIVNQELLKQLMDGKVTIHYRPSHKVHGMYGKLKAVLKKAFPYDIAPSGESNYYRRHNGNPDAWTGSEYDDNYAVVSIDDFFKPSEIGINYQIY